MQTRHHFEFQDAKKLSSLPDQSVDLVVTSPPYPMIAMWDEQFAAQNKAIATYLHANEPYEAFALMHAELDQVWSELFRVMKPGAYACINIGDAIRSFAGRFQLFSNHSRILQSCQAIGFDLLPLILWRKQTNAPNKFMGSGMLPAGAYVTLEHEYILMLRKGSKRLFATKSEREARRLSGYFWEERNQWFSDLWDFKGVPQKTGSINLRLRSGAFPLLLPFRLINMFSLIGDLVLDPFAGTGTTALAAMAAGRNSINYELEKDFSDLVEKRVKLELPQIKNYNRQRITAHLAFIADCDRKDQKLKYYNHYFGFSVKTRQEEAMQLKLIKEIRQDQDHLFMVQYLTDEAVKEIVDQLKEERGVHF